MKARIALTVEIDESYFTAEAVRCGVGTDVVRGEVVGSLECALVDVIYVRRGHGVEGNAGVRTELVPASALVPI